MTGDRDLEHELRALSDRLDVPPAPDVTAAVLARLDETEPARPRRVRRVIAAAIAAVLAFVTAMLVSPAVRAAVYDFFRIGAVEIQHQPAPHPPRTEPVLPGEHDVTLDQARARTGFPLKLPAGLGDPDHVRLADDNQVVSMAFGDLRVDQFDGGLDPLFTKFTTAADIHHVHVGDHPAVWVARPHVVIHTDRDGRLRETGARLSATTLIWEADGITYRVEGDLTQTQAIAVAESLR